MKGNGLKRPENIVPWWDIFEGILALTWVFCQWHQGIEWP